MTGLERLTGRIRVEPSELWREEVLVPQFEAEVETLFESYILIEKALLVECRRLGLLEDGLVQKIAALLDDIRPESLVADGQANMADIAFAIEARVRGRLGPDAPAWHVDRSRNDYQACAQVMFGRDQILGVADATLGLVDLMLRVAGEYVETPMPGYTHFQPAQVISPGFYLSALTDEFLHVARRLATSYGELDHCPLGAGAMAGQELPWDRSALAALLGFSTPRRNALTSVASRSWVLGAAGDLALLGVALSRFATDLMTWGSGPYGFLDLPDELCGISSAMPQKRNFPILERIRGRTAHLVTFHLDLASGQRGTPFTNMVEVSKEAGTYFRVLTASAVSVLRLTSAVVQGMRLKTEVMAEACTGEFLGGFSLANALTTSEGIDWRDGQVLAGRYISAALRAGLRPAEPDPDLFGRIARESGHELADPGALLASAFDLGTAMSRKATAGSTAPDEVRSMLAAQGAECAGLRADWSSRRRHLTSARAELAERLGPGSLPPPVPKDTAP